MPAIHCSQATALLYTQSWTLRSSLFRVCSGGPSAFHSTSTLISKRHALQQFICERVQQSVKVQPSVRGCSHTSLLLACSPGPGARSARAIRVWVRPWVAGNHAQYERHNQPPSPAQVRVFIGCVKGVNLSAGARVCVRVRVCICARLCTKSKAMPDPPYAKPENVRECKSGVPWLKLPWRWIGFSTCVCESV